MLRHSTSTGFSMSGSLVRATALVSLLALTGCVGGLAPLSGWSTTRTQGYEISDEALQQIRPGQSKDLVKVVLGSPASENTFGDESAFYYVETKVEELVMGVRTVTERTVVAIYFGSDDRVVDKAVYGLEDGRVIAIQSRRTASFGEDRTFVESILASF